MTKQKKIIFTDNEPEVDFTGEYVEELEHKLWEKGLEARKAERRAEELHHEIMKQRAQKKAAERRRLRLINCAATLFIFIVSYFWILAASAGELPALSSVIPLTIGFTAAYRWGKF